MDYPPPSAASDPEREAAVWPDVVAAGLKKPSKSDPADGVRLWRWLAVLGIAFSLLVGLASSFPLQPRQGRLILMAAVLTIAAVLVLRSVFAWAWRRLSGQSDLLIPVGVVVGLDQLLDLLVKVPVLGAALAPTWTGRLPGLTLSVSLAMVLNILLWTAFAAWQTDLLLRGLGGEHPLRLAPWGAIQRLFLRTLVVLAVGVGVLLISLIPILVLGAAVFVLAIPAIAVLALIWNLATVALLPVVLAVQRPVGEALREGFQLSWQLKSRWWRGLAAQLLLLGIFVVLRVHYTGGPGDFPGGPMGVGTHSRTQSKADISAFWVGGYENGNRWYTKYAEALQTPTVPLLSAWLGLLMLLVAVAMKATVVGELMMSPPTPPAAGPEPGEPVSTNAASSHPGSPGQFG